MAVTIMQLAEFRLGRPARTGADFEEAQLPFIGGCFRCHATVAAHNSCPTKTGYIACADGCVDDDGWETVEEANVAIFGGVVAYPKGSLVQALKVGIAAAKAADISTEDGGTCNFDDVFLVPGSYSHAADDLRAAGIEPYEAEFLGRRGYFVAGPFMRGQGNRRCRMQAAFLAAAQAATPPEAAWKFVGYYQMD